MQEETVNAGSQYGEVARCMYAGGAAPGKRLRSTRNWRVCVKRRRLRGDYEEDGQRGTDLETTNVFEAGIDVVHGLQVWPRTVDGTDADAPCLENYYSLAGISIFGESSGNARMKLTHAVWGRTNFQHTGGDTIFAGEDVFWMWPTKLWRGGGEPAPDDGTEGDNFIRTVGRAEFDAERRARIAKHADILLLAHTDRFDVGDGHAGDTAAIETGRTQMEQGTANGYGNNAAAATAAARAAVAAAGGNGAAAAGTAVLDAFLHAVGTDAQKVAGLLAALRHIGQVSVRTTAAEVRMFAQAAYNHVYRAAYTESGLVGADLAHVRAAINAAAADGPLRALYANVMAQNLDALNAALLDAGLGPVEDTDSGATRAAMDALTARLNSPAYRKRHYLGRCMLGAEPGRIGAVLLGI